jgi:hypothetical protein
VSTEPAEGHVVLIVLRATRTTPCAPPRPLWKPAWCPCPSPRAWSPSTLPRGWSACWPDVREARSHAWRSTCRIGGRSPTTSVSAAGRADRAASQDEPPLRPEVPEPPERQSQRWERGQPAARGAMCR